MDEKIIIYTDGASRGNPGPGGYSAVIIFPNGKVFELGGREKNTTNNKMELRAILEALRFVELKNKEKFPIELFSDSAYAVNGLNGWIYAWEKNDWKTKEGNHVLNKEIWQELFGLNFRLKNFSGLKVFKVGGHSGVLLNERADKLASSFADGENTMLFLGNRNQYEKILSNMKVIIKSKNKTKSKEKAFSYISLTDGVLKTHPDWESCEREVKGKSGAKYKKVFSKEEEREVIKEWIGV